MLILLAAFVALHETGALARFGTAAFGVFAAAFAPTFALALRWYAVGPGVAVLAMTVGGGASLILEGARRMPELWASWPAALCSIT
jgi:Na+(H+)/acetate symporter ActP